MENRTISSRDEIDLGRRFEQNDVDKKYGKLAFYMSLTRDLINRADFPNINIEQIKLVMPDSYVRTGDPRMWDTNEGNIIQGRKSDIILFKDNEGNTLLSVEYNPNDFWNSRQKVGEQIERLIQKIDFLKNANNNPENLSDEEILMYADIMKEHKSLKFDAISNIAWEILSSKIGQGVDFLVDNIKKATNQISKAKSLIQTANKQKTIDKTRSELNKNNPKV